MASTIKVNNIQNQCGANIVNKCSTTITLGASGDNITLACGATQSGFGRTGTVDWDTTAKTTGFTAANGTGYFVNTTSGAVTATLPAGSAGAIVAFADYANTWDTNALTITPNGTDKIGGTNADARVSTEGASVTFVYVDSTQGWKQVNDATLNTVGSAFITATGGCISTCGDYKMHVFTGPGTFCVSAVASNPVNNAMDYLVVAGGGSGGARAQGNSSAGGGAGGFRVSNSLGLPAPTMSPLSNPTGITATVTAYPITVGGGGASVVSPSPGTYYRGNDGSNSVFSTITSAGGGSGAAGYGNCEPRNVGGPGGSGGGGGGGAPSPTWNAGGTGNTPPVSPSQGNNGGAGYGGSPDSQSGGGGGAGAAGAAGASSTNGAGGVGSFVSPSFAISCAGTPGPTCGVRYFSGGAGGSVTPTASASSGGAGGGGAGAGPPGTATAGTTNTGGGGGGAGSLAAVGTSGAGGSGIVIIRYKYQ